MSAPACNPVPPFRAPAPVIGMVHLAPLPGSPGYRGSMSDVIARAARDADALVAGGVDAVLFENFGDVPFYPDRVPAETIAAMTRAIAEIRPRLGIPFGVNVLRNDARAALGIAAATGAAFVRVNVHTGAMVADQGLLQGTAHETIRERDRFAPRVLVYADCGVKHAAPLAARPLAHEVEDLFERGLADAVVLTGPATGAPLDTDTLAGVRAALPHVPILVGSGVTRENLPGLFPLADGYIVGTTFKSRGVVARARVAAFTRRAVALRAGRP